MIPLNLEQDIYIGATEFRPGNRRVVHHALIFTDPMRQGRKPAAGSADGGYNCFGGPGFLGGLAGGWAPGSVPAKPAAGYSTLLRAGTDLVLQIHYHPSGKPEEDSSSPFLFFSGPPTKGRAVTILRNNHIDIAPGEAHYVVKAALTVQMDASLIRIAPHAHYLCKDMTVDAHLPDGSVTHLIWIKDWDFNWQGSYAYREPISLPQGTRIEMEYTYDNSEANLRNPAHPPRQVQFGEQTTDEMALAFLTFALPTPADARRFQLATLFNRGK